MTKRIEAKYKIDRRMGENIWGRPKSPVNHREYGPGQHGQRRKGKLSDFGMQLRAKQKLKGYYGNISEKQFRGIYDEAIRLQGRHRREHLIGLLERRLDAIVYRAKFVPTVFAARQFVNHGHVKVNGRASTSRATACKVGDVIEVQGEVEAARAGARGDAARRARRARLHRGRPQQDDREARARPGARRRALSGADGTAPGGRVLLALIRCVDLHRRRVEPQRPIAFGTWIDGFRDRSARLRVRPVGRAPSFTGTPLSLSSACSSPAWNISRMMSQPPTNSPFT